MSTGVFVLGLVTVLMWGASGYWAGVAGRRIGARRTTCATQLTNVAVILPLALIRHDHWTMHSLGWGLLSSVFGACGFMSAYSAVQSGRIGVTGKLKSGVMALVPISVGLVTGPRPDGIKLVGIALVLSSIVLLVLPARVRDDEVGEPVVALPDGAFALTRSGERRANRLSLLSGALFGIGVIALGQTTDADGLVPLVSYRVAIAGVAYVVLRAQRERLSLDAAGWRLGLVVGVLSAIGDVTFLLALQSGALSIVPAMVALGPAVTAVLARFLAQERMRPAQFYGIAVGVTGLVLLKV